MSDNNNKNISGNPKRLVPQYIGQFDDSNPVQQIIDVDDDSSEPIQGDLEEDIELISDEDDDEDDDDEEEEDDDDDDVGNYDDTDVQAIDEINDPNLVYQQQEIAAAAVPANDPQSTVAAAKSNHKVHHPATDFDYWSQSLTPIDPEYPIKDSNHYTWEISNFLKLTEQKYTSPKFKCGEYEFHILLFPQGNETNSLALYLAPTPPIKKNPDTGLEETDPDWHICAQFGFMIWNPENPNIRYFNQSSHRFNAEEPDWGFSSFINLSNLTEKAPKSAINPNGDGFLSNSRLNITSFVNVIDDVTGVLWHNFNNYDSRKETGFSGLRNQGATCYLNSLIQSYYFTRIFRKSVLQIPSENSSNGSKGTNFTLALQRLFYFLQENEDAADTNELTRSFGWDAADSFTQHDVQELNRILMDRLEAKMKGTVVEDSLNKTFVGKMKSYIRCVNVDYESSRIEDFWDIQLNVKSLKNLNESFENYISKEMLDGENKYDAASFGLQDAEKGVVFEEFPNVLHLQLKRFDYDFMYDALVKINDRHEFPENIDLKPYLDKSNSKVMSEDWEYELYAVLIHSGDISSGHYYAMIKPDADSGWFRFDDDKVIRVTRNEVFEDNFGHNRLPNQVLQKLTRSQYNEYQIRRHTSAYMLVYFRKSKLSEILCDFDKDKDIPKHIRDEVEREKLEAIRKKQAIREMHLYLKIHLYGASNTWVNYQGFDLGVNRYNGGGVNGRWNAAIYENPGELKLLENSSIGKNEVDISAANSEYTKYDTNLANPPKILKKLRTTTIKELYEDIIHNELALKNPDAEYKYIRLWILAHRKNETTRPDLPLGYKHMVKNEDGIVVSSDADGFMMVEHKKNDSSAKGDGNWDITHVPESISVEQILDKFSAKKSFGLYLWVEDIRDDLSSIYNFGKSFVANDDLYHINNKGSKSANRMSLDDIGGTGYDAIADVKQSKPETSNDLPTKFGLLPDIPRNFLEFPRLFESIHDLIEEKLSDDSMSPKEKEEIKQIFKPANITSTSAEILIFIKYFDRENQTLTGLSHLIVSKNALISSIVPILNYTMGWDKNTKLAIYEEIKPTTIELVKQSNNFLSSELQNGDILVFAKDELVSEVSEDLEASKSKINKLSDIEELEPYNDQDPVEIKIGNKTDGDVITVTKKDVVINRDKLIDNVLVKSDTVLDFYKYLKSRVHLVLRPEKQEEDESLSAIKDSAILKTKKKLEFQFWAGAQTSYVDIAEAIGKQLNIDSNHIRLYVVPFSGTASIPLKKHYTIGLIVGKNFNYNNSLTLEYEILKITLDELSNLKLIKLSWLPSGVLHEHVFEFLVDKSENIDLLLDKFVKKINKNNDALHSKDNLLVWRVHPSEHRIVKTCALEDSLVSLPAKSTLYVRPFSDNDEKAEINDYIYSEVPSYEKIAGEELLTSSGKSVKKNLNGFIVEVIQFFKDPSSLHGIPFHFVLKKNEKFADTKKRLQLKLSLGDKEFSKVQIGLINKHKNTDARYCSKDAVILYDEITENDAIFLDHPDRTQHRANFNGGGGGAIFIKN